jgi:hypothetical protein
LKRQKSISSTVASISAWNAVFDWPSIVDALIVSRHEVVRSSAAFRKTAARSSYDQLAHSFLAHAAASMACTTCCSDALWYFAEHVLVIVRHHGLRRVAGADLLAAEMSGLSTFFGGHRFSGAP